MAQYTCTCGHTWSDITGKYDGYIVWQNFDLIDRIAGDTLSFASACTQGTREEWIADYFSHHYPSDLSNAEIVSDIVSRVTTEMAAGVFRCPQCQAIMLLEEDRWVEYFRISER